MIEIKKELRFNYEYNLPIYNYNVFKSELSEFVDFFYPYFQKKSMDNELKEEFYNTWKTCFESLDLSFTSFIHKDYNLNNLIYLPNRKKHYKCGIIDFQIAFGVKIVGIYFLFLKTLEYYLMKNSIIILLNIITIILTKKFL